MAAILFTNSAIAQGMLYSTPMHEQLGSGAIRNEIHTHINKSINQNDIFRYDSKSISISKNANIFETEFDNSFLAIDCNNNTVHSFSYSLELRAPLNGAYENTPDSNLPEFCQLLTNKPYTRGYDRGYLIPPSHVTDGTSFMSNTAPLSHKMNFGAWKRTQEITECANLKSAVDVIGGAIYNNGWFNDYFVNSHGIKSPEYLWKVMSTQDGLYTAWLIPNSDAATASVIDRYEIDLNALSQVINDNLTHLSDHTRVNSTHWVKKKKCR